MYETMSFEMKTYWLDDENAIELTLSTERQPNETLDDSMRRTLQNIMSDLDYEDYEWTETPSSGLNPLYFEGMTILVNGVVYPGVRVLSCTSTTLTLSAPIIDLIISPRYALAATNLFLNIMHTDVSTLEEQTGFSAQRIKDTLGVVETRKVFWV